MCIYCFKSIESIGVIYIYFNMRSVAKLLLQTLPPNRKYQNTQFFFSIIKLEKQLVWYTYKKLKNAN